MAARVAAQSDSTMKNMPGMNHGTAASSGGWSQMPNMSNVDMSMGLPMPKGMPMMPGLMGLRPKTTDWRPGAGINIATLAEAVPRKTMELRDGDTLNLEAKIVKRTIAGKAIIMYGYNGQYPGPMIKIKQNSTITVKFKNSIDLPSTVHWHGVRLENRNDGVPGMTQEEVKPGGTFTYRVHFPDAGVYWYHPHVREDIEQDLGLFGNMIVDPTAANYYSPVNREEVLTLDDFLVNNDGPMPWGKEAPDFVFMGRFGNLFLVNGEPEYHLEAKKGEVVRFFLTNVSNTRVYNITFGDAPMKIVASDVSKFEHEETVKSVVIAPAQRYIVEVKFPKDGEYYMTNSVQAINHFLGEFYSEADTLGMVMVDAAPADKDYSTQFATLRENADVKSDIDKYRPYFDKAPDKELSMTVQIQDVPLTIVQFLTVDTAYRAPIEWNDGMPDMNWLATGKGVRWILRDKETAKENMDVDWHFKQGDIVKIRLTNERRSMHPMQHPIHLHGQRFLVVARDGVPVPNKVWKDTELVSVGQSVDILLDASNPGKWMLHCHIAEHLQAGMMTMFTIDPSSPASTQ
jgi:FtsP/CotA-like multicopper oxidase with cupredoxin domain